MEKISDDDAVQVAKWLGLQDAEGIFWQYVTPSNEISQMDKSCLTAWLLSPEGQMAMIKKILVYAALHLEEIPKPEAVIMPFCDIAGRDDYEGHGETTEDALINAVLKFIEAEK